MILVFFEVAAGVEGTPSFGRAVVGSGEKPENPPETGSFTMQLLELPPQRRPKALPGSEPRLGGAPPQR